MYAIFKHNLFLIWSLMDGSQILHCRQVPSPAIQMSVYLMILGSVIAASWVIFLCISHPRRWFVDKYAGLRDITLASILYFHVLTVICCEPLQPNFWGSLSPWDPLWIATHVSQIFLICVDSNVFITLILIFNWEEKHWQLQLLNHIISNPMVDGLARKYGADTLDILHKWAWIWNL